MGEKLVSSKTKTCLEGTNFRGGGVEATMARLILMRSSMGGTATCIAAGENLWQDIRLHQILGFRCHGGGCRVVLSSRKNFNLLILAWRIELNFQRSTIGFSLVAL
jgi:hypothetical protein